MTISKMYSMSHFRYDSMPGVGRCFSRGAWWRFWDIRFQLSAKVHSSSAAVSNVFMSWRLLCSTGSPPDHRSSWWLTAPSSSRSPAALSVRSIVLSVRSITAPSGVATFVILHPPHRSRKEISDTFPPVGQDFPLTQPAGPLLNMSIGCGQSRIFRAANCYWKEVNYALFYEFFIWICIQIRNLSILQVVIKMTRQNIDRHKLF